MKERGNRKLRFLDRYIGIPLVFMLGAMRRKRAVPECVQRIALLKSAGIGDLVLLSGIIRDLKGKELILFTGKANCEMGALIEGVKVVPLPITRPFQCIRTIRKYAVDVWVDCDAWPRINALLSFFARARCRIGFKTKGQARHYVYDQVVQHSFEWHELDNYRALLQPLGMTGKADPKISVKHVPREKRVVLHLFPGGARADLKEWPAAQWRAVITHLKVRGFEVELTGSKADRPKLASFSEARNRAGELTLEETAHHLAASACVISVDTGIMHLAAALGTPVIGLHGPTSPDRWGAVGENVISLTPPIAYTPCIQLGFEAKCSSARCMKAIQVDQVLRAFEQINQGIENERDYSSGRERDAALASLKE